MSDEDYLMALKLQTEFDKELEALEKKSVIKDEAKAKWKHRETNEDLNCTQNLVHPEWETLDPTPDVQALFVAFDNKFFQGRLKCVTLEWSKRMYSCAGICYSRKNRYGMAITIRLSEPLLKLRSRKDLVETLLHEMIHAYCSVLGIREGNGGHGPNFKKIMHGINKVAGTNITVYHTFHDEVDMYKIHWWRCNGICQNRKPFFGYVKRTSNRAPGPNDIWWKQHLESCGGTFLKIRGPEKKKSKLEKENNPKSSVPTKDIRSFFGNENKKNSANSMGFTKSNGGGTIVINDDNKRPPSKPLTSTPTRTYQGSVNKVVGFKDLNGTPTRANIPPETASISGTGYSLTSTVTSANVSNSSGSAPIDRDHVRNIWANKFSTTAPKRPVEISESETLVDNDICTDEKRRKLDSDSMKKNKNASNNILELDDTWTEIDEEIMLKEDKQSVIDISSDEEESIEPNARVMPATQSKTSPTKQTAEERQKQIKQEILDSSDCLLSEDEIELIDDEYNDDLITANAELADTSLIEDLFGEDTLLQDFKKQNAVFASNSRYHSDPKNDIVCCPVCQDNVTREFFSEHLDGCVGISQKVAPPSNKAKVLPFYKRKDKSPKQKLSPDSVKRALKNAGYDESDIEDVVDDSVSSSPSGEGHDRRRGLYTSTHACPVCGNQVEIDRINEHLDICLPGH